MKKDRFLYAYFAAAGLALFAFSDFAQAKTLEDAIETAWKNHPALRAAQASEHYAESDVDEQRAAYFPKVNVNANGGRLYGDNSTTRGLSVTRGAGYSYTWETSASISQQLYDGGARGGRLDAAKQREKAAEYDVLDSKDILANSVAQAYIDLVRIFRIRDELSQYRRKIDDYIMRLKAAVDQGAADESELRQAEDVSLSLYSFVTDYERQLKSAQAVYYELVGEMPDGEMNTPVMTGDIIPGDAEEAIAIAKQSNAALEAAYRTAESYLHEADAERAAYFPEFGSELSYLKSEKRDLLGGEVVDARALVRMNWTFDTGGSTGSRVAKSRYRYEQSRARAMELEKQIERSLRLAYAEYDAAMQQLKLQTKRLALTKSLFETYETQFEGARISLLQLLQADNQSFLNTIEHINAQNRLLSAQYSILSAMGRAKDLPSMYAEAAAEQEPEPQLEPKPVADVQVESLGESNDDS